MTDPHAKPVDHLAAWYDDETLRRIDATLAEYDQPVVSPVAPSTARTHHSAAAGLAFTVAALTGVKDAIEPEPKEVFEEIDPGFTAGDEQFVTLYFVPGDPQASRAVVRPWLAPSVLAASQPQPGS